MTLNLNGLDVDCIIGDRADERTRPQTLRIDATLEIPPAAAQSDALRDTLDYVTLTEDIRRGLVAAKCQMIERAAKVVFDACARRCATLAGAAVTRVAVTKAGTLPRLDSVTVVYP